MQKEKGFTLLEMCVCFILFSIFLECIWSFYTNVHINNVVLNQQIALNSEGDNVEAFIQESIRDAEQVKITVQNSGGGTEEIEAGHSNLIEDQELVKIEFRKDVKVAGAYVSKKCSLEISTNGSSEVKKGKQNLIYKVDGESGYKTISDQIENIKVTSAKDSNLVSFKCTLQKQSETNSRLTYTQSFSESLAYKAKLT